jgi:hypothetical protein
MYLQSQATGRQWNCSRDSFGTTCLLAALSTGHIQAVRRRKVSMIGLGPLRVSDSVRFAAILAFMGRRPISHTDRRSQAADARCIFPRYPSRHHKDALLHENGKAEFASRDNSGANVTCQAHPVRKTDGKRSGGRFPAISSGIGAWGGFGGNIRAGWRRAGLCAAS